MQDALYFLLNTYLKKESFVINQDELKLQLLSHPSYPSLHSVTGVLDHFNIDNMALEVPANIGTLKQLPKHFITLTTDKNQFVIVSQVNNNIHLFYGNKKKKIISEDEFLGIWGGVIVVVEKDEVETSDVNIDNKTISKTLSFVTGLLIFSIFFFFKPSLFESFHFILSLIGIWISFLIIKHEYGFQSKTLDKICTANEATNCDAVLNSKGASISNYLKLSDISLIYFIGLTLSWLLSVNYLASTNSIVLLTLIALPITIYSIYYQYKIVKKWCPLCLGIVTVLWLQCCTLFFNQTFISSIKIDYMSLFILFFSFLLIASLWLFIKPLLNKQQELEKLKIEHYKFKRNFDLFNALYKNNKFINTTIESSNEIVLGNKNAPLQMLLVTSPSCFYCKAAHTDIAEILNNNSKDINLTIRFNVPSEKDNISNKVVSRLLEIYNTKTKKKCIEALHDAYKSDVNLEEWILKWGESKNSYDNLLKTKKQWCVDNNINFTPALYINGKQFPKEYNRSDINYFIEDLIEQELNYKANIKEVENELV